MTVMQRERPYFKTCIKNPDWNLHVISSLLRSILRLNLAIMIRTIYGGKRVRLLIRKTPYPTVNQGDGSIVLWGCFAGKETGSLQTTDGIMNKRIILKYLCNTSRHQPVSFIKSWLQLVLPARP